MADRTCSVDGCDEPHKGRGFCQSHYNRWRRWGDPLGVPPSIGVSERFAAQWIEGPGGCWLWTGVVMWKGYGVFRPNRQQFFRAHRWAYEHHVGPIPDGLVLDHLCRVRHCVNPDHLEPVTRAENTMRGKSFAVVNAAKTTCVRGHDLTDPDNVRVGNGRRHCRACRRILEAKYRDRRAS